MIINTGCRTDIPAYYSQWFYNRIREGCVLTRNPYYPDQIIRYRLDPEVVDCINFCTKNPEPMFSDMELLKDYGQLWFVTITPYGKEIEPNVPPKEQVMDSFLKLSEMAGRNAVRWRYDPIFITGRYTLEFHLAAFEYMAKALQGSVEYCVVSFLDLYEKTKQNFPLAREVTREERETIGKEFSSIGKSYGISLYTCCEGTELEKYGIDTSGCMTKEVIEKAIGCSLEIPKSRKSPRADCRCILGNDIGAYHTCGHGCVYCYANISMDLVNKNRVLHDPESPLLIGNIRPGEVVREARQETYSTGQMKFSF